MFYQNFVQHAVVHRLTNHARKSLVKSARIAKKFGCPEILTIHLLYAIHAEKGSVGSNMLSELELSRHKILKALKNNYPKTSKICQAVPGKSLKKSFVRAYAFARKFNCSYVGTEHFVYSIISSGDPVLKKISISLSSNFDHKEAPRSFFEPAENFIYLSRILNLPEISSFEKKTSPASKTPCIDKYCVNINEQAQRKNETIINREKELERIISVMGRKNKNNPLLIGEPGVGKTALVSGLALLIQQDLAPSFLHQKIIMSLDVAQLIAGTNFRGELESRLKEIIREASCHKEIILFIDEAHNIIGAGNASGSLDLANMLKPALGRGEFQVIGATTLSEYKKYIEKDAALERRFQPIHIQEPAPKEAEGILRGIKSNYEDFHNATISDDAIKLAVDLSVRYIQNRQLPDKAIDVLDETAARLRSRQKISNFQKQILFFEKEIQQITEQKDQFVIHEDFASAVEARNQEQELRKRISLLAKKQSSARQKIIIPISREDIAETISKMSGIPLEKLLNERNDKIKNIETTLGKKIIGQKEAVKKLSHALLRSQSGLSNPDRPLGSFLFLGPTGVGKTLTAKILAHEFFNSKKSLIRIDMSEFMEHHSVSSLIGSPAGYIGYGEGGNLTEKVRLNPYSVVLFDEIEKAHPNIFNILLQILEDGILTDAQGLQVNFKNTLVILTSNIGTDELSSSRLGFGTNKNSFFVKTGNTFKEHALRELERKMKPELLNRLDHVIIFNALTKKEIGQIAALEMEKLRQRVRGSNIALSWNDSVIQFLANKSLSNNQGARLVRKNIQEHVENPLAKMLMYDKIKNKSSVKLTVRKDKILLE